MGEAANLISLRLRENATKRSCGLVVALWLLDDPDEQRTKLCLNVSPENRKICLHKAALNVIAHASRHCHDLWNRSSVPLVREERSSMLPAFVLEHYDEFALPSRSIHAEGGVC